MDRILTILRRKSRFSIKAEGNSMLPVLMKDDVVYIRKKHFNSLKTDDIICCSKKGKSFIHRVIYLKKDHDGRTKYLVTKGDNSIKSDGKIFPANFIGLAYQIKRKNQIFGIDNLYLIQSSIYFQEIIRIKKAFEREKVDFVFLKGLPVHLYYEKKHPRRIYADCDILIAYKDLNKVTGIFSKNDYSIPSKTGFPVEQFLEKDQTQYTFIKKVSFYRVIFDIHFRSVFMFSRLGKLKSLDHNRAIDDLTVKFLREKKWVKIQKDLFPMLNDEDNFLYFCLNIFHHNFKGVFRFDILNTLMDKKRLNYYRILDTVKLFNIQNYIYPVILLFEKYYPVKFPKNLLRKIKPEKRYLKYIYQNILNNKIYDDGPGSIGIIRFKNLFFLSPVPLPKRLLVFFNPQVIYSVFWVMKKKFRCFSNNL